jgi:pimeloyl-ACP methyl ester carboxylesterase
MQRFLYVILFLVLTIVIVFFVVRVPSKSLDQLKEKYANAESEFVEIQGMPVHYRIEGQGHPLVLIHGTASSLHTWDGWTEMLKDSFQIVRLDMPAFALTGPHEDGDYSYDFYVQFLDEFVQKTGLDTFALAGNSLGGAISWNYALQYPEKLTHLILVDASGIPKAAQEPPLVFKLAKNPASAFLLKHITPRSFIEDNIRQVYYNDLLITEELVDRYYDMTLREGNRQAFIDRVKTKMSDRSGEIQTIALPTLIQWGRYDEWIPVQDGFRFQELIQNSSLILYEAGHVPMEELPKETALDVREFLLKQAF